MLDPTKAKLPRLKIIRNETNNLPWGESGLTTSNPTVETERTVMYKESINPYPSIKWKPTNPNVNTLKIKTIAILRVLVVC
jgi:hypothetical protein